MIAGILAILSTPPAVSIVQTLQTTDAVNVVSDPNRSLVYVLDKGKSGRGIYRRDSAGRYSFYGKAEQREHLVGTDHDGKPMLQVWQPLSVVGPIVRRSVPNFSYQLDRICAGIQLGFAADTVVASWSDTGAPFFSDPKRRETVKPRLASFSAAVSPDRSTLAVSFHDFIAGRFLTTSLDPQDAPFTELVLVKEHGSAYDRIILEFAFLDAGTLVALTVPAAKKEEGFRDFVYDGSFPKSMSVTLSLIDLQSGKVQDLRQVKVSTMGRTRLASVDGKVTIALLTSPQQLTIVNVKRPQVRTKGTL